METKRGKTRWEKGERVERGKGKFELCGDENKRGRALRRQSQERR